MVKDHGSAHQLSSSASSLACRGERRSTVSLCAERNMAASPVATSLANKCSRERDGVSVAQHTTDQSLS